MNLNKKLLGVAVATSLAVGMVGGAAASGMARQITASLDSGISIVYNNQKQDMKDASGNAVYPISYNGTTYVPVRAVSTIFGQAVDWDAATETIYLGTREVQPIDLTTRMGAGNDYCWKIADATELTVDGSDAKATYKSGVHRVIWNSTMSSSAYTLLPIATKGMTTVSFTAWSDIDANVLVLTEKGDTIASVPVSAGSLVTKEINISGYDKIAFGANAQKNGVDGIAKIFEPTAK